MKFALEKNEKDNKIAYEKIQKSKFEQMNSDKAQQWRQP